MDPSRDALLRKAASYESWAAFSALIVVFGVAVEALESKCPKILKPHVVSFTKSWRVMWYVFFIAPWLVAGGVLGEWWCGVMLTEAHAQIRQKDDIAVAVAQKDAAEAGIELEHLKQANLPRFLPDSFLEELKKSKNKFKADVFFEPGNSEASSFANGIANALLKAGWEVLQLGPVPQDLKISIQGKHLASETLGQIAPLMRAGGGPWGITVVSSFPLGARLRKAKKDWTANDVLFNAFQANGVPHNIIGFGIDSNLPSGHVRILVGPK